MFTYQDEEAGRFDVAEVTLPSMEVGRGRTWWAVPAIEEAAVHELEQDLDLAWRGTGPRSCPAGSDEDLDLAQDPAADGFLVVAVDDLKGVAAAGRYDVLKL